MIRNRISVYRDIGHGAFGPRLPGRHRRKTITVTIWAADDDTGACWSNLLVDTFPRDDISIEVVLQPGTGLVDAQRTALQGGAGPDITFSHGPSFMLELASAGLLLSLDHYADEYDWEGRFAPWALDLGRVEGSLYSLSEELETVILYYNKTVFDANGWEITQNDGRALRAWPTPFRKLGWW